MAFQTGLEDLVVKVAARAGLTRIRNLVGRGLFEEASHLAKTPGVLKPLEDLAEREGTTLLHRGRSPGHQVMPLGMGREQAVTLVADPQYGLVARKTHLGAGSATVPAQMDLKAALGRKMTEEGFKGAPQFHDAFQGPAGRKIHLTEYVPHVKHMDPLHVPSVAEDVAKEHAIRAYRDFANEHGYAVEDMRSKGNTVTTPTGEGKVLDSIVSRTGMPGKDTYVGKASGRPKSHGEVMREVFNPSVGDLQQHDAGIEAARARLRRRRA
jgi:hypothetical protein